MLHSYISYIITNLYKLQPFSIHFTALYVYTIVCILYKNAFPVSLLLLTFTDGNTSVIIN